MTADEVCIELGMSRKTLYNRVRDKRITPIREKPALDKEPLKFLRSDVEALKSAASPPPPKEQSPANGKRDQG